MKKNRTGQRLTYEHILCALVLLVFFEPPSLNIFVREHFYARFFSMLGYYFTLGKLAVSLFVIFRALREFVVKGLDTDYFETFLFLHIALIAVSLLANREFSVSVILQLVAQTGMLLTAAFMLRERTDFFLLSLVLLFGALAVCGCASFYLHPRGYVTWNTEAYYYLLGGKNTAFPYELCFLISWILLRVYRGRRLPPLILITAFFIGGSRICDSTSTTVCLSLFLAAYLAARFLPRRMALLRPAVFAVTTAVVVVLIYLGMTFKPLLDLLGRTTRFSGRDVLWAQALAYFRSSPLFGCGNGIRFTLDTGIVTDHAHSQYLNRLAKFGLVPFSLFAASIIALFRKMSSSRNRLLMSLLGALVSVYLLHMAFDDYNYTFFILIVTEAGFFANFANDAPGRLCVTPEI